MSAWFDRLAGAPPPEPDPSTDYMVGQIAANTVLGPDGQPIVETGQPITADVLTRARRAGLLHCLEAEFG